MKVDIFEADNKYIMNTYQRLNLVIEYAEGAFLYDADGNKYLDMYSGIAVNNLGHDKSLAQLIAQQAHKYIHLSNYFVNQPAVELAKLLVEHTFADQVFFTNSGTEANEAAIKLCRKYGRTISPQKTEILSAKNAFHGRTTGALTLTGREQYRADFRPLLPCVGEYELNNIASIRERVSDQTCAVFLELIQGEGGIVEVTPEFIQELVCLAKCYKFLIVVDEVQTGLGRSGHLFAYEKYQFEPDIMTLSKSLGGGLPLGAMLVASKFTHLFQPGDHGSTFAPNPVACTTGKYILEQLVQTSICQEVMRKGNFLLGELKRLQYLYPTVIQGIRGSGFMIGVDVGPYAKIVQNMTKDRGVLLNITNQSVIRLLPPLNISCEEVQLFLKVFEQVLIEIDMEL